MSTQTPPGDIETHELQERLKERFRNRRAFYDTASYQDLHYLFINDPNEYGTITRNTQRIWAQIMKIMYAFPTRPDGSAIPLPNKEKPTPYRELRTFLLTDGIKDLPSSVQKKVFDLFFAKGEDGVSYWDKVANTVLKTNMMNMYSLEELAELGEADQYKRRKDEILNRLIQIDGITDTYKQFGVTALKSATNQATVDSIKGQLKMLSTNKTIGNYLLHTVFHSQLQVTQFFRYVFKYVVSSYIDPIVGVVYTPSFDKADVRLLYETYMKEMLKPKPQPELPPRSDLLSAQQIERKLKEAQALSALCCEKYTKLAATLKTMFGVDIGQCSDADTLAAGLRQLAEIHIVPETTREEIQKKWNEKVFVFEFSLNNLTTKVLEKTTKYKDQMTQLNRAFIATVQEIEILKYIPKKHFEWIERATNAFNRLSALIHKECEQVKNCDDWVPHVFNVMLTFLKKVQEIVDVDVTEMAPIETDMQYEEELLTESLFKSQKSVEWFQRFKQIYGDRSKMNPVMQDIAAMDGPVGSNMIDQIRKELEDALREKETLQTQLNSRLAIRLDDGKAELQKENAQLKEGTTRLQQENAQLKLQIAKGTQRHESEVSETTLRSVREQVEAQKATINQQAEEIRKLRITLNECCQPDGLPLWTPITYKSEPYQPEPFAGVHLLPKPLNTHKVPSFRN